MKPLLIASVGRTLSSMPFGRREDDVEVRRVPALPTAASLDPARATVVVVDRVLLASAGGNSEFIRDLACTAALVGIGDPGEDEPPAEFPAELLTGYLPADAPVGSIVAMLRGGFRHAASLVNERRAVDEKRERVRQLSELTNVGLALSTERDLMTLLEKILSQARRITGSDAGSLYLIDATSDGTPSNTLRFMLSQNHTLPSLELTQFTVPIDHTSLAGYSASTGESLVVADVYLLPDDVAYKQNRTFDEKFGYRTKSMLVAPLKTHRNEVVGVVQLINRKRNPDVKLTSVEVVEREVIGFDQHVAELVSSLASQAVVAIENSRLNEDIERLFEGFVTAAVMAIESRDPTTSGHSSRVAQLTVGLAEAVDRGGDGPYRALHFTREQMRELRYAALLHDFGKVGVREQVLVKEKKLYPEDLETIRQRFAFLFQATDLEFERKRADLLAASGRANYQAQIEQLREVRRGARANLARYLEAIVSANEPSVLPETTSEELREIRRQSYVDFDGQQRPLLSENELRYLMIPQGNLDDRERREIESHVTLTYRFLEQIPWTRELKGIPILTYLHHEKLNGQGYPRAISADEIPVQARMMTITDIFDALTAKDRPYKRAVPWTSALDILDAEARDGMLDEHLLKTFVDARVFEALISDPFSR